MNGHISLKMLKIKDSGQIFKIAIEKQQLLNKGTLIRITADYSGEMIEARRWGNNT